MSEVLHCLQQQEGILGTGSYQLENNLLLYILYCLLYLGIHGFIYRRLQSLLPLDHLPLNIVTLHSIVVQGLANLHCPGAILDPAD